MLAPGASSGSQAAATSQSVGCFSSSVIYLNNLKCSVSCSGCSVSSM
jgi:hypothetical protein